MIESTQRFQKLKVCLSPLLLFLLKTKDELNEPYKRMVILDRKVPVNRKKISGLLFLYQLYYFLLHQVSKFSFALVSDSFHF